MPNAVAGDSAARGGKAGGGKGGGAGNGGGKGAGGGNRPRQGDWACLLCGFQSNRGFRGRCWNCEGLRNPNMEHTFGAYAQRQMQQQRQAQGQQQRQATRGGGGGGGGSPTSAECKDLRQRLEKLQAELAATKALATRGGAAVEEEEDEDMGEAGECDYAAWTEEERAKRLELARGGLAYAAACHGDESPQAAELRETIAALQKASREAKPFKAHRNLLERRRDELRRRQERDEAAVKKVQSEMDELKAKLDDLKVAIDERAKAIASVTEELNDLVRKTLAEEGGDDGEDRGMPSAQQGSPWAAVSAALQPLAGQPGIPADVASLLVQVQHIAEACAKAAAASTQQQAATRVPTEESQSPAAGLAADIHNGVLAPQWRRGKAAARSSPSPQRPHPPNPTAAAAAAAAPTTCAAAAADGNAQRGGGGMAGDGATTGPCPTATSADDGAAAAAAATIAAAAAATATSAVVARTNGGAADDELLEEIDGSVMQVDLEESISALPDQVQRRLRAALGMGGGGGQAASSNGEGAGAGADSRRQERERSPRPTKAGGDKEL